MLGTYVAVEAIGPDDDVAGAAVDAAFRAVARVQRLMSAFEPDSDVGRINASAHSEPVRVDAWTAEVLALALEIHRDSGGLFDIGIAPRLASWQMLPPLPLDYPHSSITSLHIDGDAVHADRPLRIDLGGIAKGYAADRAAEAAMAAGATSVLVNAGGDLRVAGDAEEPIYLRDPKQPTRVTLAGMLQDGAIATSGIYFSKQSRQGVTVSAIVHPSTGAALQGEASYSVVAPHCAVADALTKVLALSGNPDHPAFARHRAQAFILQSP